MQEEKLLPNTHMTTLQSVVASHAAKKLFCFLLSELWLFCSEGCGLSSFHPAGSQNLLRPPHQTATDDGVKIEESRLSGFLRAERTRRHLAVVRSAQIHFGELECVFYACEACASAHPPLNHRRHTPFLSSHQVHGVLDLYPAALAHPCGMPCIFKQVLHFEISSRRDISRRLNISGSRVRQPPQRKYQPAPHQAATRRLKKGPRNCPAVSIRLRFDQLGPLPAGLPREVLSHCMPRTPPLGRGQTDAATL